MEGYRTRPAKPTLIRDADPLSPISVSTRDCVHVNCCFRQRVGCSISRAQGSPCRFILKGSYTSCCTILVARPVQSSLEAQDGSAPDLESALAYRLTAKRILERQRRMVELAIDFVQV